jgi:hypothetical protein
MPFQFLPRGAFLFAIVYFFSLVSASSLNVSPELRGKRSLVELDGVMHTIFDHEATGAQLDFVTDSGVCETTPGVRQYSGYLNVGGELIAFTFLLDDTGADVYSKYEYVVLVL